MALLQRCKGGTFVERWSRIGDDYLETGAMIEIWRRRRRRRTVTPYENQTPLIPHPLLAQIEMS